MLFFIFPAFVYTFDYIKCSSIPFCLLASFFSLLPFALSSSKENYGFSTWFHLESKTVQTRKFQKKNQKSEENSSDGILLRASLMTLNDKRFINPSRRLERL